MDVIEINRLHVRTEVGFSPHELGKLQELIITIHLKTSKKAGQTDRVEDTINYDTIANDVLFHVENKRYNLIEAVAADVAHICVVRHGVPWVKVLVQKPNCLRCSDYSSVTIERRWEDFDWEDVHVSIGSNSNPFHNIPKAISLLKEKFQLTKLSKAFRTTPVGFKEQEDFINMAAVLRTKLDPAG
jgi:FolB domain-containing protein